MNKINNKDYRLFITQVAGSTIFCFGVIKTNLKLIINYCRIPMNRCQQVLLGGAGENNKEHKPQKVLSDVNGCRLLQTFKKARQQCSLFGIS